MGKRPRINIKEVIGDGFIPTNQYGEIFQKNAASENAKHHCTYEELLSFEFWIDKHYVNRNNFGDENGERDGIHITVVEHLIKKSFKHLFYYSLKHKNFSFINHPPKKTHNTRVVITDIEQKLDNLNIVIEYHFLDFHKYEVTVITAMRENKFRLSNGQYNIQFNGNESSLMFHEKNNDIKIDEFY